MEYSPTLEQAIVEIKAILVKYDIAGFAIVNDGLFGEYLTHTNASWSCVHKKGDDLIFQARTQEDFNGDKQKKADSMSRSFNMLDGFGVIMGTNALHFMTMIDKLKKITNWESGPIEITSHVTQNRQ